MADIFLSYNREDQIAARRYAQAFEQAGLSVWWDTTLKAGEAYDEVTEAALRGAKAVVVLWSPRSVVSRWVRAEATLADRAKTLLPVTIEPCERPIMFELTQTPDLSHWTGAPGDPQWTAFLDEVRRFVGRSDGSEPSAYGATGPGQLRETVLAVLAFDNLSNDPELSYFSDGVSEEILYTVARAKGLRVIGKGSSFQFRGSEKTPQKIAAALGATHMLDGSVRRSGDNIRINVELVDTTSLHTVWSERYDRALTDIFALQDDIAGAVATALHHHFSPAGATSQVDPAAYDLYLQARAIFAQDMTWQDQKRCAALLEGAVALDGQFSQAWGLLAGFRKGPAAVAAAERGLELNPDCATALAGLASTKAGADEQAERLRLIDRAYALAPDSQFVSSVMISTLLSLGLLTRAMTVADANVERDPLSPLAGGVRAFTYCYAGRNAEAAALADAVLAAHPHSEYVKFARGAIAIYTGDLEGADAIADTMTDDKVMALRPPVQFIRWMSGLEPEQRAAAVQKFLLRHAPKSYLLDIGLASVVGEIEPAIAHLLNALDKGAPVTFTADNDGRDPTGSHITIGLFMPAFRPIRLDPRFADICVRMGLYDCWKDADQWPNCADEVAPYYDFRARCEEVRATV